MPAELFAGQAGFADAFDALINDKRETSDDVNAVVADILRAVRERGDEAVIEYTSRFDKLELTPRTMRIPADAIEQAYRETDPALLEALETAASRIREYHGRQLPESFDYTDAVGVRLGSRWRAVQAAGLYVPGGTAAYPSSVLMNVIPAKVAGVERLVMCVPAPNGVLNPLVLAAAKVAGVDEIYRHWRRPGDRRHGLWYGHHRSGGQDCRSGQCVCRRGKTSGFRYGGHRQYRWSVGNPGGGGRGQRSVLDCG